MDPNANLQEQERIIDRLAVIDAVGNRRIPDDVFAEWREARQRLRELRNALTDWLAIGGFEPDWSAAPNARNYYGR